MLTAQERLDLYKVERDHLDDELFGTAFPSFKEWNEQYRADYRENHQTVTTEEADAMFDEIVDGATSLTAGAELSVVVALPPADVVETASVTLDVPVKAKKKVRARPVAKAKTKRVAAKKASKPARSGAKKSDQAREIIKANKKLGRKEVMAILVKKVKLSEAAANTYFYKYQ